MRFLPKQIVTAGSMAANVTSEVIDLNQVVVYAIQAVWTGGTADGTLKLQLSNQIVSPTPATSNPGSLVTQWTDYTGSSTVVAGAGDFMWNCNNPGYRWVRLVFTRGSGTGTLNATISGKAI